MFNINNYNHDFIDNLIEKCKENNFILKDIIELDKKYKNNLCVCVYKKDTQTKCTVCASLKYNFKSEEVLSELGIMFEQDTKYYVGKTSENEYIKDTDLNRLKSRLIIK